MSRSEQMARISSQDTHPELELRKMLWSQGYRYRLRNGLPGRPDLTFPAVRVAVFVDGCFWHGCPQHYRAPKTNAEYWRSKVENNIRRDRRADEDLESLGWKVCRLWEHQIRSDLDSAISEVDRIVRTSVST